MTSRQVIAILLGTCLVASLASSAAASRSKTKVVAPLRHNLLPPQASPKWGSLPLTFEPNLGQTDPRVRFVARAQGMTSFLTDRENVMVLTRREAAIGPMDRDKPPEMEQTVVRMKLEGSHMPHSWEGEERAESISNYFIGNDPSKWRANVPNYGKVRARGVYQGIDLVYYGDGRQLEYDFVVKPGADPGKIRLAYDGADSLSTDAEGNLLIATRLGTLVQRKPDVYQELGSERREIAAAYTIRGGTVEVALANWDRKRELIIDPVLVYSTYVGTSGAEQVRGAALDPSGAVYLAGFTASSNFPTTTGAVQRTYGSGSYDAFVTKLNTAGSALVYSTYLGGNSADYGFSIAVDAAGSAYVTGQTASGTFPITAGAFQATFGPFFVTKLNSTGSALVYSTYLGSGGVSVNIGGYGIAVDSSGAAYVTGTAMSGLPTTAGAYQTAYGGGLDAFVTKLNATGSALVYSTYLGGPVDDYSAGIAVDSTGAAYVTGQTDGSFPTTPGAFQAVSGGNTDTFVAKLNSGGSALVYSTYLGGSDRDLGQGIAIDPSGAAYVTGPTSSSNFPVTPGAYQTTRSAGSNFPFVTKLDANGSSLAYSTFLGGNNGFGVGRRIAVDGSGVAYVTGLAQSTAFATTACAYRTVYGGGLQDAFMIRLSATGSGLLYSTYLGGAGSDYGHGVVVDSTGLVYVAGYTDSSNFPVTTNAYQTTFAGSTDAFVTKLDLTPPGPPATIAVVGGSPQTTPVTTAFAAPLEVLVTDAVGNPVGGVSVTWTVPGGGAAASLSTASPTDCNGKTSTVATANNVAGSYVVTAAVAGVTTPASFNLTNGPGPAASIAFVQQPTNTPAGSTISQATVLLKDAYNNPISGTNVTLTLQPASATLQGTLTQPTNASGIATFSDLKITTAGAYQLQASGGGQTGLSNFFNITAAVAQTITAQSGGGQTAVVNTAYAAPLKAIVQDSFGNPVAGVSVTFALPTSGPGGTFAGPATVTTGADGVATSLALTANVQAGAFQVTATAPGVTGSAAFGLTSVAGAANKLVFVQQPSDSAAGDNISPAVTVQVEDSFGNKVASAGTSISLQLLPSGTVFGTGTRLTDSTGLATFTNINVTTVGQYQLLAVASGPSSATSNSFTIRANRTGDLRITGGTPQSTEVLTQFALPLQGKVTDGYSNPISGERVVFDPPTSGASASLSATSATTDANGNFSITATANNVPGPFFVAVRATTGGPIGLGYDLTNLTASPGTISFPQQPTSTTAGATITPAVVVRFVDGSGAPVAGATITLSIVGSAAALNGTVTGVTDSSGQVTYSDLSVYRAGAYNLLAVTGSLSGISAPFTISSSRSSVAISAYQGDGQSAAIGTPFGGPLKALVVDSFGNPLSGVQVVFDAPATGASATFSGSTTVTTDASGIATSPALTANSQIGSFQVTATAPGAPAPATFTLTDIAGGGGSNKLSFVQQPTDTIAGQIITPAVTVQLQDSSGNPVLTAGVPIAVQSNTVLQSRRLFVGNATQNTNANGLATFSNLSISLAGAYQLQANATNASSATSNPFKVTAGAPSSITPTGGAAQSAFVMTVFGAPLEVTVTDAAGNPISGVPVTFIAPSSGQSATLGGQLTLTVNTNALGRAQAVATANNIAGDYVMTATSPAITGSATFSLTNLPLTLTVLRFVQQPSNAQAGQVIAPPVRVQVQNSTGGAANVTGVPIILSLSSGAGTLFGTIVQVTDATGTATFNDLRIGAVGAKQLTASSAAQPSAVSNTFQITAGAPATITAISGTPQATGITTQFPLQLQAEVKDIAGNPVSGASVTFAAPTSGPSGTFAAAATVMTDTRGIATAPGLTANNTVGSFAATATVAGVNSPAAFVLTNLPQQQPQPGGITINVDQINFTTVINQTTPPPPQVINITSNTVINWTATTPTPWIVINPASGTTPAQVNITVNPAGLTPGNYSGTIIFTSPTGGMTAAVVTFTVSDKPALVITPPSLVFTTSSASIAPPAQTLQATSSSTLIGYRVSAQVRTPTGGNWLSVSPGQGQTVGNVTVNVNPSGLSRGIYNGSVLFTPTDSAINSVAVPVTLLVACQQGGCTGLPATILSVVNAASFHPGGAPGAAMTIFGLNLSDGTYQAPSYPLPTQLGPTTVTVNGTVAPLYYVSPTQINFQMPTSAPAAGVQIVVNDQVKGVRASQSHNSSLTVVDPGLFTAGSNRAAALNQDLSIHTALTPQPAGAVIVLYLTGQGPINPALADGMAAPGIPLSLTSGTTQVSIGGRSAQVLYSGVAPGFAGLAQVNAVIPQGLVAGDQPVFISINGVSSNAGLISVR